uniref:Cytochrome c oxidase subunit 5B, mitochondrial n=1 Tax=Arion vulgaris TaxID=1028688 RepID=A0A0B6ZR72_9EUPU
MAATLWRTTSSILRRPFSLASIRCSSGPPSKAEDVHKGKVPTEGLEMPDDIGHSVGLERSEILARETGNDDPFELKVFKRSKGTFEEPTIFTSPNSKRMIGCVCEEESLCVNWMYVHKGEPKRCECGYWFKLIDSPHGHGAEKH